MYLVPTSSAEHLARQMEGQEGIKVLQLGTNKEGARMFPDGEVYARLEGLSAATERVAVLHSGQPDPNGGLMELEMILEILRRAGVGRREVFFAYFPYGMQDKAFREGELNAADALLRKLVAYYGVSTVYALDPHFQEDEWLNQYVFKSVSALPLLKEAALRDYPEMIFVAPDEGSQGRTKHAGLSKTRTDSFTVDMHHDDGFAAMVRGRDVGVIDDLVETGGTLARFREKCAEYGARSVAALVTHGVLPAGIARLRAAYDRVYLADGIARPEANVAVAPLVVRALDARP